MRQALFLIHNIHMSSYSTDEEDLKQREQNLHEREMQLRLRELEAELEEQKKKTVEAAEQSTDATVPHEMDSDALAKQRKTRKIVLLCKFVGLSIGVAVTVITLNFLLFPMIVVGALCALGYGGYVLFIKESPKSDWAPTAFETTQWL